MTQVVEHPQAALKRIMSEVCAGSISAFCAGVTICVRYGLTIDGLVYAISNHDALVGRDDQGELERCFQRYGIVIVNVDRIEVMGRWEEIETPRIQQRTELGSEQSGRHESVNQVIESQIKWVNLELEMDAKRLSFWPGFIFGGIVAEILPIGSRPHENIEDWISGVFDFVEDDEAFGVIKVSLRALAVLEDVARRNSIEWLALIAKTLGTARNVFDFEEYFKAERRLAASERSLVVSSLAISCNFGSDVPPEGDVLLFARVASSLIEEIPSNRCCDDFAEISRRSSSRRSGSSFADPLLTISWRHYSTFLESAYFSYFTEAVELELPVREWVYVNLYQFARERRKTCKKIAISVQRGQYISNKISYPEICHRTNDLPLEFLLLAHFDATAFSGPIDQYDYEDHFELYDTLIRSAGQQGQFLLMASLFAMLLVSSVVHYGVFLLDRDAARLLLVFSTLPSRARSALADMTVPLAKALLPKDVQREFLLHFDAESRATIVGVETIKTVNARQRLFRRLGADFNKLSEAAQHLLVDAEKKWELLAPDFGTGDIDNWGNIAGELFKVLECELKEKARGIEMDPEIANFLGHRSGEMTGGAYIYILKEYSKARLPKSVAEAVIRCARCFDLERDKSIWAEMSDALYLRNRAFHPSSFDSGKFHRMRELIMHKDKGLLRRLIDIIR